MDIVEFQGAQYRVLSDGLAFYLKPVEYRANDLEHHLPFGKPKAESKILSRIAHKGQEWDIVADSLGLKLVLVGGQAEPNWAEAPADATHYSKEFGWFLKEDPSNPDHWLYWHKKPHHLAKGKWMPDGSHPEALVRRPEQTGAIVQKPADATHYCPINDAFVKITPLENFRGYNCEYYRDGQWVIENPVRFSALVSLTKPAKKPTASQKLTAEISESYKKLLEQTGAKVQTNPTASQINDQAMKHIRDRASTYDQPQGERSMGKTVRAFNAITGRDLTESEGWLLLQVLKDVRQWQNPNEYHQDSGEDCIAYAALKAESLAGGR